MLAGRLVVEAAKFVGSALTRLFCRNLLPFTVLSGMTLGVTEDVQRKAVFCLCRPDDRTPVHLYCVHRRTLRVYPLLAGRVGQNFLRIHNYIPGSSDV